MKPKPSDERPVEPTTSSWAYGKQRDPLTELVIGCAIEVHRRLSGIKKGLLINFLSPVIRTGIKRIVIGPMKVSDPMRHMRQRRHDLYVDPDAPLCLCVSVFNP